MPAQQRQALADAGQHAQRQAIDLEQAQRVQVVLVPLDDGALGHRRVFHRHQMVQWLIGYDEAAHVLGQVARETHELGGQLEHAPQHRAGGVKATFAQALVQCVLPVPPGKHLRQQVDLVRWQAQCTGNVAYRALAAVADDRGRQCRAVAAVLGVDVLEHLLAPLVLEVDVDVRRLVALPADEALDQQVDACRIDLGDAQRIAHGGVGGRAAALAEDVLAAGETHDVMHGEEVRLVGQFGHQLQLVFDLRTDLVRHAVGPAPAHALFRQVAQPACGGVAVRHQFGGVAVAQFGQAELATVGKAQGFGPERGGVDRGQRLAGAQVALTILEQHRAGLGHGLPMGDRGPHVLQRAAPAHMHVHVAGRDQRDAERGGHAFKQAQAARVVGATMQFHCQPQTVGEQRLQPCAVFGIRVGVGQPQCERARQAIGKIRARQVIRALGRGAPATRDQRAQRGVAGQVFAQQHQFGTVLQLEFGAHDQLQPGVTRRFVGAHDAGQRAFVGDRQRGVAAGPGTLEQLARAGRTALEGEVGQAMQLGVVAHANHPCSIQCPLSPGAQYTHARWPARVRTT